MAVTSLGLAIVVSILLLASTTSAATCPTISRSLSRGASGTDVTALQQFLITQGVLSAGSATGYFGLLTEKAVQTLQSKASLVSSGTPATTGFGRVGARTRALIAAQCASSVPKTSESLTSEPSTPRYLLFQLGGFILQPLDQQVQNIVQSIGVRGDHERVQLGFVPTPLNYEFTDKTTRQIINDAFQIAVEQDVAVAFHIDDGMFWGTRTDLWEDPQNVEWSDWSGTTVDHRIIGWFANGAPVLAPPMCYNAAAIKAETMRKARDLIGAEIKKNIDRLHAEGKDYLFAGVISGWETRMQDDSNIFYGYCALTNAGYSASNPPADLDTALVTVMNDWISLWATSLEQAGIPKEKIYTHIAYQGGPPQDTVNPLRTWYFNVPPDSAFNANAGAAGFSLYDDDGSTFAQLYDVLAGHAGMPWGISEAANVSIRAYSSGEVGPQTMEQYLANAFNHGAAYVNIYGYWNRRTPTDPIYVGMTNEAAIAAYQKFLSGQPLSEGGTPATIQGIKFDTTTSVIPSDVANQTVSVGTLNASTNPYYITVTAGGPYIVTVPALSGYAIGYTLCIDRTDCHNNAPTPGTSASVTIPSGTGHYADLWWHYTRSAPPPSFTAAVFLGMQSVLMQIDGMLRGMGGN